jgi:hypothetical protein
MGKVMHPSPQPDRFDVVKGMLALMLKNGKAKEIPADTPLLHEALFELSKKREYGGLVNYIFERRTYFPFSREFQTDLINLEMSGHLTNPNPSFEKYNLEQKLVKNFDQYAGKIFTPEQIQTLEQMSRDFLGEIKRLKRRRT